MKTAAPEVKIINHTSFALELLIYTKSSRLAAGTSLEDIMDWPNSEKAEHLDYMMNTIMTSFEFVDYVFEIKNVSRAFTHQLVRTRTASFQQESLRTVDARNSPCLRPIDDPMYDSAIDHSLDMYSAMIDNHVNIQDARGVLPTAIQTNIIMKANLRTISDMAKLRLCKRTQGEYQDIFKMMVQAVLEKHPWAAPLLTVHCVRLGVCAFPRYTKCPVQKFTIPADHNRAQIEKIWKASNHVANPVTKNGKTM